MLQEREAGPGAGRGLQPAVVGRRALAVWGSEPARRARSTTDGSSCQARERPFLQPPGQGLRQTAPGSGGCGEAFGLLRSLPNHFR